MSSGCCQCCCGAGGGVVWLLGFGFGVARSLFLVVAGLAVVSLLAFFIVVILWIFNQPFASRRFLLQALVRGCGLEVVVVAQRVWLPPGRQLCLVLLEQDV